MIRKASQPGNNYDQPEPDYGRLMDRVVARKPNYYDGKTDPGELENCIINIEKVFDVVEGLTERQVSIDSYYLSGKADARWGTMREKRKEPGFDWDSFKTLLHKKMLLHHKKEDEFLNLQQDKMSVTDYATKFEELSRFAVDYVAIEKMKKNQIERGLDSEICQQFGGHHITTYQELYDRAIDVERVNNLTKATKTSGDRVELKRKWDSKGHNFTDNSSKRSNLGQNFTQ